MNQKLLATANILIGLLSISAQVILGLNLKLKIFRKF